MSEKLGPLIHRSTSTELLPEQSPGIEKTESLAPVPQPLLRSRLDRIIHDGVLLLAILVMLCWPWIFFGVVRTKTKNHLDNKLFQDVQSENYFAAAQRLLDADRSGIQAGSHFANLVINHRSTMTFVITLIGTAISLIVSTLFSLAVRRVSQEWNSDHKVLQVFHIVLLTGFRRKSFPWQLRDLKHLSGKNRWPAVVAVCAYLGAMAIVTSSVTGLLTPVNIILQEGLTARELDLSANASECLEWFSDIDAQVNNGFCNWQTFQNLTYNICLGQRQMIDALEAGQGQILTSLSGEPENVTFTRISDHTDLHFAGPIRGVMPGGPNGVFSLSTGQDSTVTDIVTQPTVLSYNYTLLQQGLSSNVSCEYTAVSPIDYRSWEGSDDISRTVGNCSSVGAVDISDGLSSEPEVNAENSLAYWACQSKPQEGQDPAYLLYFQGLSNYSSSIGNMTCTVSPLVPAIFPVKFESAAANFFVDDQLESTQFSSSAFVGDLLFALADIVSSAQNFQSNLLAEVAVEAGVRYEKLSETSRDPAYLRLFEALVQGVLEYEATYNRLIYTASTPSAPSTCTRAINGWFSYQVIGWSVTIKHVFFLLPMTLVNLASLAMMLTVLFIAKGNADFNFDPTDPRQLIYAEHSIDQNAPDEWVDNVEYLPRENPRSNIYRWGQ